VTAVVCCYFAAFVLELFRFIKQNRLGWIAASAGFILHTLFLVQQHVLAERPIGGAQMYFLLSAWGLIVLYFFLFRFYPSAPFGFFLLPAAMIMIQGSLLTASVVERTSPPLIAALKMSHAGMFLLATLSAALCTAAGTIYLLQNYLLQKKWFNRTQVKLPSLEWSYTICRFTFIAAMILMMIGMLIPVPMKLMLNKTEYTGGDPLFIGLLCFFFLLFVPFSSDIPARILRFSKLRLVTAWTMITVLFLTFLFLVAIFSEHAHWRS
jgi:hypothetical protein